MRSHFCRLHNSPSEHRQSVSYGDEMIVVASSTPQQDAKAKLVAKGLTGEVVFLDPVTSKPKAVARLDKPILTLFPKGKEASQPC